MRFRPRRYTPNRSNEGVQLLPIVVTCYTGQSAAWGVMMLRLLGYSNTYSLKWGMCSWDSTFAQNRWLSNMKNDRAAQFVTSATATPPARSS